MAGKKQALAKGAEVKLTDRWWALTTPSGRPLYHATGEPHVYATRADAIDAQRLAIAPSIVIRLDDITGTVYR